VNPSVHPAAVIAGIGSWLPHEIVTNHDLAQTLDTSDEWIRVRTGITARRRAALGETTSDLAVEAGRRALKSSGDDHVDAVVLATTTPDHACPGTAPTVAARLGLGGAAAFDVSAVCTGFIYALASGAGLIATGTARRVLVVGADIYSTILDPGDRGTCVIFGDAAGAVVLREGTANEPGALGPLILGSDGDHQDLIQIAGGGARQRSLGPQRQPGDEFFTMVGPQVYRHAVNRMAEACTQALAAAEWTVADVDRLAAHQANARLLQAVAAKLDLPEERVLSNIDHVGNTSAASIPLLLDECDADGRIEAGQRILLTAFGGGLTWGATTVRWPALAR
jgi:3-oxoacyl-[acyl-carrier-protein] synthase-3